MKKKVCSHLCDEHVDVGETLDDIEEGIERIIAKHRGKNPMADYGATEALIAVRKYREDHKL